MTRTVSQQKLGEASRFQLHRFIKTPWNFGHRSNTEKRDERFTFSWGRRPG
jgi:hypothetical protein